jgi:hypothetical protein
VTAIKNKEQFASGFQNGIRPEGVLLRCEQFKIRCGLTHGRYVFFHVSSFYHEANPLNGPNTEINYNIGNIGNMNNPG